MIEFRGHLPTWEEEWPRGKAVWCWAGRDHTSWLHMWLRQAKREVLLFSEREVLPNFEGWLKWKWIGVALPGWSMTRSHIHPRNVSIVYLRRWKRDCMSVFAPCRLWYVVCSSIARHTLVLSQLLDYLLLIVFFLFSQVLDHGFVRLHTYISHTTWYQIMVLCVYMHA